MGKTYELNEKHIKQLHSLYQDVWWAKGRTLEDTRQCVLGSQICIGLLDDDSNLIGFARVLTDGVFKALIFDVIVAENMRYRGLGEHLITLIKSHPRLKNVRHFELYCLPDMQAFYTKCGFNAGLDGVTLMRYVNA